MKTTSDLLWNLSCPAYEAFAARWPNHIQSFRQLVKFADIGRQTKVLYVGSGTAHTVKELLRFCCPANCYLIDSSSAMIEACRHHARELPPSNLIQHDVRCPSLLSQVPRDATVLLHLSVGAILSGGHCLQEFARFCSHFPRVAIAATNGELGFSAGSPAQRNGDPIRENLRSFAAERQYICRKRRRLLCSESELTQALYQKGFKLRDGDGNRSGNPPARTLVQSFSAQQRVEMWQIPAILDTEVDILGSARASGKSAEQISSELAQAVETIRDDIRDEQREIHFLSFDKMHRQELMQGHDSEISSNPLTLQES